MQGGVYRVVVLPPTNETNSHVKFNFNFIGIIKLLILYQSVMTVQLTSPNTVSILWLLPQIFVVSIAEILFAVTLITFSFTEVRVTKQRFVCALIIAQTLGAGTNEVSYASDISTNHRSWQLYCYYRSRGSVWIKSGKLTI